MCLTFVCLLSISFHFGGFFEKKNGRRKESV
ncbi:hypothetical protein GLYMA_07G107075v4 [Glycine max]|nr:hypothetical protein GLYMA_07G107075v4 [Glycine max]KAH1086301.1 hypothetical protein GYH30_018010 [Glycine max]